jgi:hypothetical protein
MSLAKHFNRVDSTPAGHPFVPEISCRDGTGALYNTVTVVDGRGVTVPILIFSHPPTEPILFIYCCSYPRVFFVNTLTKNVCNDRHFDSAHVFFSLLVAHRTLANHLFVVASLFRPSLFRPSLFRPPLFRPSLFRPPLFRPSLFRPPLFRPPVYIYRGNKLSGRGRPTS